MESRRELQMIAAACLKMADEGQVPEEALHHLVEVVDSLLSSDVSQIQEMLILPFSIVIAKPQMWALYLCLLAFMPFYSPCYMGLRLFFSQEREDQSFGIERIEKDLSEIRALQVQLVGNIWHFLTPIQVYQQQRTTATRFLWSAFLLWIKRYFKF